MRLSRLLSLQRRSDIRRLGARPISRRLGALATWYGTDKGPRGHGYTVHYERYLRDRRLDHLKVLEIGVGGQETNSGGASLRMWRTYLPKAEIVGVDLFEKDLPSEKRLTVLRGDQSNRQFLATLVSGHGPFDVVIDDGSHRGEHINVTFTALWPGVRSRGWYVIEDLETAFDPAYGGGAPGLAGTSLDLLKGLLDGVQGQTALEVRAVHVHPNIAFIEKP